MENSNEENINSKKKRKGLSTFEIDLYICVRALVSAHACVRAWPKMNITNVQYYFNVIFGYLSLNYNLYFYYVKSM